MAEIQAVFPATYGGSLHNSMHFQVAAITVAFANSFESFVYDCVCCYFMSNSLSVSVAVANSYCNSLLGLQLMIGPLNKFQVFVGSTGLCLVLLVTSALLSWLFSGKEGFAVYT
jgi:hypothetical protein